MDFGEIQIRLIAWGGYDRGKPRVRLLLNSLRERGALTEEINIAAWSGIEDKSVAGPRRILSAILHLFRSYPFALWKLLRSPPDSHILLPYPAILDIFVVWPLAAVRQQKIVLDAFIPAHDTIVRDRAMLRPGGVASRLLWHIERLALRLADIVIVDTDQHGAFFAREFDLDPSDILTILVGAEPLFQAPAGEEAERLLADFPVLGSKKFVLFYGQLIPLHGLSTIIDAARLTQHDPIEWVIVGRGQEERLLEVLAATPEASNLTWIKWVDYQALPALIRRATVALGIFGTSEKAARVLPNKLFQVLAAGKAIITRDSPAVQELAQTYPKTIITVPPGDPLALAEAVRRILANPNELQHLPAGACDSLGPTAGAEQLLGRLQQLKR